jgi:hypothetical protein
MTGEEGPAVDHDRIALAIQQPWAELILRGIKTLEIRSQPTRQRGTVYLYISKRTSRLPAAETAARRLGVEIESLPSGLLVGTVDIVNCRPCRPGDQQGACVPAELLANQFAYELDRPHRLPTPQKVRFLPYGVWFYSFKRRPRTGR